MAIAANFSTTRPSLLLDFSNQTVLDPRVTFARTTTALYYDNKSAALAEQNLFLQSNTFTTSWTVTAISTPVQGVIDPAGGALGWTLTPTITTNAHNVYTTSAIAIAASTYTVSVYFQAGGSNFSGITVQNGANTTNYITTTFNLTSGSVAAGTPQISSGFSAATSSVTQVGSTNWWRCVVTFTTTATSLYVDLAIHNSATPTLSATGLSSWTAAGTETLLVYGAQLEQRSSPTVYTATTATAVNNYTPTLQTAAINSPRFDYNPTTRESLGLLLEQASTNNQLYSSNFDNAAWTKTQAPITTAADISPDGTQNAQLMVLSTTSAAHTLVSATYSDVASTTYTLSIYAKAYGSTSRYITFGMTRSSNDNMYALCNFDLVGGTAGTAIFTSGYVGSATANIQPVGNGWYRCSVTYTTIAVGPYTVNMFVVASNTSVTSSTFPLFAGNGFDGYLLWGAQNETAPSATSYIANTAGTATVRTTDAASMTGTNFSSWYNYSGGTVYVEAASGNPTTAASPATFSISDASNTNQIANYFLTTTSQYQASINGVAVLNTNVAFPTSPVANTFYKISWYFSTAGYGISSVGQTATTGATSINAPAVNKLALGASSVGAYPLNGRIKKFAYYPLALTNTQIQSLSAN